MNCAMLTGTAATQSVIVSCQVVRAALKMLILTGCSYTCGQSSICSMQPRTCLSQCSDIQGQYSDQFAVYMSIFVTHINYTVHA